MAEKMKRVQTPSSHIVCPLCLDVFKDATLLTCGHTFCQSCLEKYDSAHQDLDNMVCPLCRKTTVLDEKRVVGLPKNITVNGMVEEYLTHGEIRVLGEEVRPKCTACETGGLAVSFCRSCGYYMCDECFLGHQQFLTSLFRGHSVITMKEITERKLTIDQFSDKCSEHERDERDLFCEDCKVYVCFKCTLVGHRGHRIRNRQEVEDELQKRVENLLDHCTIKQKELETNILDTDSKRPDVHVAFQKLRNDVEGAFEAKVEKISENGNKLTDEINELTKGFDDEIDKLKESDRQMIKRLSSYAVLIEKGKLRHLERDSLTVHNLICEELAVLLETQNAVCGADILETAQEKRLILAHDDIFDIGKLTGWQIITQLELPHPIRGIASNCATSVVVTQNNGVTEVHSDGRQLDWNVPKMENRDSHFSDIALIGRNIYIVLSWSGHWQAGIPTKYYVYSVGDSKASVMNFPIHKLIFQMNASCLGEILLAGGINQFWVYDPSQQKITHTVQTKEGIRQAFGTKSGLVVTSTCSLTDPSIVRVYDREGNGGDPLTSSKGEYLSPAVDSNDQVFVATINKQSGKVQITLYDLEGLNLKERMRCDGQELTLHGSWCYVSLPCNVLAFACEKKLYFIKYPHF